jgi:EAL domain-containing protein (putative c-di-GMP-specific phosphodiesterase class I)
MSAIPRLREVQDQLGARLRAHGGLGAIQVDLAPFAPIERSYGAAAYQTLQTQLDELLLELKKQLRAEDMLARDDNHIESFLVFLSEPRQGGGAAFVAKDLQGLADRVDKFIEPRVARLALPYLRERPSVAVGYGFVLHSPIESGERQILRLVDETRASAELRVQVKERAQRESLLEIIFDRKVWTVFQPILEIETLQVMGHEALSRGPRGTELQPPLAIFGLAARHGLTEELERCCRRRAFKDWQTFGAPGRLFVNTVSATVRDPSFLGRGVVDYLGPDLSPRLVTLEITEREIIENLTLYREAMHSFIELGFTFAIDDVGKGYSGLETIASLGVSFLKIDMSLVRGVHEKRVSQQIVKAIHDLGQGVGAAVIAEGVETREELAALKDLGLRYAQGYLFGQPLEADAGKSP